MTFKWSRQVQGVARSTVMWITVSLMLAGCRLTPQLRITNSGTIPIKNLTVLFPNEKIAFGDIPAGATTAYHDVPQGVYSYAAYQLEVNGTLVTQPVIDWVGESPMTGNAFTYTLEFDPARPAMQTVQLVNTAKDK